MSSSTPGKRALPPKIAKMRARKKQKLMGIEKPPDRNAKIKPHSGQTIKLNDLEWTKITLPDQMDDYEGFFGLEEIEGIDVVRNEDSGKVSYKIAHSSVRDGSKTHDHPKTQRAPKKSQKSSSVNEVSKNSSTVPSDRDKVSKASNSVIEEDEWSGLDDPVELEGPNVPQKQPKKEKRSHKKQKQNDPDLQDFSFSVLKDEEMDVEDDEMNLSGWKSLSLSLEMSAALAGLKFSNPTPIQSRSIPPIMEGRDLVGKAPTGSGKTLAFGIPMIEEWLATRNPHDTDKAPIALIILPTRELAHQIAAHLTALCSKGSFDNPYIATLTGGMSIQKQRRLLSTADIVVGTPGRLWEVVSEGHGVLESLKKIKYLVLDEADRLLTEGHFQELEKLLTALNRKVINEEEEEDADSDEPADPNHEHQRQTLVFSATFSKKLQQRLAKRSYSTSEEEASNQASMEYLLKKVNFREEKPVFVDVNPSVQMAENLQEALLECAGPEKDLYLYAMLLLYQEIEISGALVFVNAISAVRRLVPFLTNLNMTAYGLHSQMPQKARLRSIERFSQDREAAPGSNCSILVATDVAARGLDIPNVPLVVHYNVPRTADTYVHRSGRTARADKSGTSVLICAPSEAAALRRLVAQVHGSGSGSSNKGEYHLRSVDVDTGVIARLRPRASIAKKLADAVGAKERKNSEDSWMKQAAEELGVDMDDAFGLDQLGGKKARKKGSGRKQKEDAALAMTKSDMAALRAELKALLAKRINVGVSERYLTSSGAIDIEALLQHREKNGSGANRSVAGGAFLGSVGMKLVH